MALGRPRLCDHDLALDENCQPYFLRRGKRRCGICHRARVRARYARISPEERREQRRGRIDPSPNAWPEGRPRLVECLGPRCSTKFLSRSKSNRLCSFCGPLVAEADALGLGMGESRVGTGNGRRGTGDRNDLRQSGGTWSERVRRLSPSRVPLDFRRHDE